jgi:hypothetical protein
VTLGLAIDTVAVRLLELANEGKWDEAKQREGPEQSLAMLRVLLYGDIVAWLPRSVIEELRAHGDIDVVANTEQLLAVQLLDLPVEDPDAVEALAGQWEGKIASANDARWLAEATHVNHIDLVVTFDQKLIRGTSGEVLGKPVMAPLDLWSQLAVPKGANPRRTPAPGHPLYGSSEWVWK